ncbi:MAG: prepilin-type N-terminal cleavage/methylation domain-containing protein [Methylobacter sp.]|nr:prepilin-type N-terminal cleavage/methylation domain-containing protein [Methylobacter sp.]
MLKTHKQQKGVTLIELMIGLLIGMIVVAGGISVFTTSIKGQTDNQQLSRLNQDMRAMMDIMVRDIRRAGFVTSDPGAPANFALIKNNPFFAATTDIDIHDYDGGTDNCIVYSYNANDSNPAVVALPSPATQGQRFGFRLNSAGILSMRSSGNTNINCTDGSWETITEPEVQIIPNPNTEPLFELIETELNVSVMSARLSDADLTNDLCNSADTGAGGCGECIRDGTAPDPACLYVRNVKITLTGRLRDDPNVTQTITGQVRVRNDKFLPALP